MRYVMGRVGKVLAGIAIAVLLVGVTASSAEAAGKCKNGSCRNGVKSPSSFSSRTGFNGNRTVGKSFGSYNRTGGRSHYGSWNRGNGSHRYSSHSRRPMHTHNRTSTRHMSASKPILKK